MKIIELLSPLFVGKSITIITCHNRKRTLEPIKVIGELPLEDRDSYTVIEKSQHIIDKISIESEYGDNIYLHYGDDYVHLNMENGEKEINFIS